MCLNAIFKSDYPETEYEVIVIVDGKCDQSVGLIKNFQIRHGNLSYLNQIPNKGPASARNTGIKLAKGSIIGFTDDDCEIDGQWIKKMTESHIANPDMAAVGGETIVPGKSIERAIGQYLGNMSIQFKINGELETIFFPTCNVSIKKEVLEKYSFDETFPFPGGEDLEYFWRLYKNGFRFIYDSTIVVKHHRSKLFKSFIKQNYYYGRGNLQVYKIHPDHPTLQNLTLKTLPFFLKELGSLFNRLENAFWRQVRDDLIQKYSLSGIFIRQKVGLYLKISRIFYMFGKIREFVSIKFSPVQ